MDSTASASTNDGGLALNGLSGQDRPAHIEIVDYPQGVSRDLIHPGKFLADELEALNMSPAQ